MMSDEQDGCEWVNVFWYQPTQIVPDKGPLNGCVCEVWRMEVVL